MDTSILYSLSPNQRALIEGELQPGETIAWTGRPKPRAFTLQTIPLFLFAIPWTGFAIFWVAMALRATGKHGGSGPGLFFPLFGVPFVLVGIGMLSSPLWMKRLARRTIYLITDRRAIVFQRGFSVTTRSYSPEQLQSLTKRVRPDGSGDIIFAATFPMVIGQSSNPALIQNGFYSVANFREVERLLLKLCGR